VIMDMCLACLNCSAKVTFISVSDFTALCASRLRYGLRSVEVADDDWGGEISNERLKNAEV
jgi:hypothetical protein